MNLEMYGLILGCYLLGVEITTLDCIIPHQDENLCQGSCCHFQA